MNDMTTRDPVVVRQELRQERITKALCIDCGVPVFTMGGLRCDGCAEIYWNETRDEESPVAYGPEDDEPDDDAEDD